MSQAWTVLSGKGGVGKSTVSAALGMALARRRLPCCLVDADLGLRSLDMLMNLHSRVVYDVLDVARRDCKLKYALIRHTEDGALWLLPAAQEGQPGDADRGDVERIVKKLKKRMAYVLLDAPAGLGPGVRALLPACDHALVVTTPDDVAMRDAERAIALTEAAGAAAADAGGQPRAAGDGGARGDVQPAGGGLGAGRAAAGVRAGGPGGAGFGGAA